MSETANNNSHAAEEDFLVVPIIQWLAT